VKKILVVGTLLSTGLFVTGIGAALGVVLGARALVVSADAVKPAAPISIAVASPVSTPAVLAMGQ
jgi:hypothetical protein